ncbi:MAG: gliding motility protein GldL, partial [Saprospiraceae bacterium]
MANVLKSKGFKYIKNLIIGVGASVVLMGALFKIQSWPYADEMLTYGMITEAILFLMLGLIPPDKDYYWEKLYPGLDQYNDKFNREEYGLSSASGSSNTTPGLDGKVIEGQLGNMIVHLQT